MTETTSSRHRCAQCGEWQSCGCHKEKQDESVTKAATVASEQPGKKTENRPASEQAEMLLGDILVMAQGQGYSDFSKIERKGGCYKVKAKSAKGEKAEICFDAKRGEIVKQDRKEKPDLSKKELIARREEQGYPKVSKIKRKGGRYRVTARDVAGKDSQVHVDAKTGEIVRKEQELKG